MPKTKLISFITSVLLFWKLWLPDTRVAFDYPYWYPEVAKSFYGLPVLWRDVAGVDGLGQFVVSTLFIQPVLSFIGLTSNFGISFDMITKLVVLTIILSGVYGVDKLLEYYKLNSWARVVGTLFFALNSYLLLLIDGGQLYLALGYSLLPLAYYLFIVAQKDMRVNYLSIFVSLILSIFDLRIYGLFILLLVANIFYSTLTDRKIAWKFYLYYFLLSILFLCGIHSFWLLPVFFSGSIGLSANYGLIQQVESLSFSTLGNSLYFQEPHWYKNIFGVISRLSWEFAIIPVLVFSSPILKPKNKIVGFWLAICLISLFLSKGTQEPFGNIYSWFYQNIPGFTFFRDSSKFYFIQSLAYSILLAFTVDGFSSIKLRPFIGKSVKNLLPVVIVLYLIYLIRPIYLGEMTGLFSTPRSKDEFTVINQTIKSDENFSRVLWVPKLSPLGYADNTHPAVEAIYLGEKRPFASGVLGSYETLNFLREAPYMGELLKVASVKYLVFPPLDPKRDDMKPENVDYYYQFLEEIKNQPWISHQATSFQSKVLVTNHTNPRLFLSSNLWWVIGSDEIYNEAVGKNLDFSNNSFVFAEEDTKLGPQISNFPNAKVVLYKKTITDLAINLAQATRYIPPASQLSVDPDHTGWWKRTSSDLISWKNFLREKYGIKNQDFDLGGGWAVSEGENSLDININAQQDDILFARVLESTRSGEISFSDNGREVSKVNTNLPGDTFKWIKISELSAGSHSLLLKTSGDINVVNMLALLNKGEFDKTLKNATDLQNQGRIQELKAENISNSARIEFNRLTPTSYKIKISGVTSPQVLVFSENYNHLWQLDGHSAIPVYSFLNGYLISSDGEYDLVFVPQNYVLPGLLITLGSYMALCALLIYQIRRKA
jgi:hypothetical protein